MTARPLALLAFVVALVPVSARADLASGPAGAPCRFVPTTVGVSAPTRAGIVTGGPYAGPGTLTCRVASWGSPAQAFSATGTSVVVLGPTSVTYPAAGFSYVSVCTEFTPTGGPTVYWHDPLGTGAGYWGTTPGGCAFVPDVGAVPDPADLLTCACDPGWYDYYVCPYLSQDQDLYVGDVFVWDCPPYQPS